VLLISWSLAAGLFPRLLPNQEPATYWLMGIAGALGLFASILFHEMAHARVAQRLGIAMRGITLFVFGGVAEMTQEPPTPGSEFRVAVAGPIATLLLVAALWAALYIPQPATVAAVLSWIMSINLVVVLFNLIPAFPLDGGRILRSGLWAWRDDLRWATRLTSRLGSGFGVALMILAVLPLVQGNFISAMWSFLLGMFLRHAAQMSYRQVLLREALRGEPIRRFMTTDIVTVPRDLPLDRFVDDYVYHHRFKVYPAMDDGHVVGCVSTDQVRQVPQPQWRQHTVGDVMEQCSERNTIAPDADAVEAMRQMSQNDQSRLLVIDHGRLQGMVALRDLMRFLSLKMELEGDGNGRGRKSAA
jgi:Zn-dependent protease/predicted transcriptional regulator